MLVTDRKNESCVSLQAKFSKDFLVTHMKAEFQKGLRACGWWVINQDKLRRSPADFWVFVLHGFARRTVDFVIVPPMELWKRLKAIHGSQKLFQTYIWVNEQKQCWETRGLSHRDQMRVADGDYPQGPRDFTKYLNNWSVIAKLN